MIVVVHLMCPPCRTQKTIIFVIVELQKKPFIFSTYEFGKVNA